MRLGRTGLQVSRLCLGGAARIYQDRYWHEGMFDTVEELGAISLSADPRYYSGGVAKLEAFARKMKDAKAAFIVELGDLSDDSASQVLPAEQKRQAARSFQEAGEAKLALSDYRWEDANVPEAELSWLRADLSATRLPTIVLTHQLLNPLEQVDPRYETTLTVRNAAAVRSILEASGVVVGVFSGHYHAGGFQKVNGISYVVLQANVVYGNDVSYHNQFAVVDVYSDGRNVTLAVWGNGLQRPYLVKTSVR